jgi:hypothetical protein
MLRSIPPLSLIVQWLKHIDINNFNDFHTFTASSFPFEKFNDVIQQAEPYYYPCKATKYLKGNMTIKKAITILRQLLNPYGYTIITRERTINNSKCYDYYLFFN